MLQNNKAKGGDMEQMNRLLGDGGMMDDSGEKVNGVEVPVGSLKEEVADDIPAQLSEGEFVVPADVVRFIGLEKLMQLRDKAKQGLLRMEEMGQMGNAQEVEDPDQSFMQDDEDFGSEIDDIMAEDEPAGFKTGGFITGSDISRVPSNPAVAVGYYKHSDGRMMWITKINGKPMSAPPDGFSEVSAEEFQNVGKKADEAAKVVAKPSTSTGMTGASGQSDGPDGFGGTPSSTPAASIGTGLGLQVGIPTISPLAQAALSTVAPIAAIPLALMNQANAQTNANNAAATANGFATIGGLTPDAITAANAAMAAEAGRIGFGDNAPTPGSVAAAGASVGSAQNNTNAMDAMMAAVQADKGTPGTASPPAPGTVPAQNNAPVVSDQGTTAEANANMTPGSSTPGNDSFNGPPAPGGNTGNSGDGPGNGPGNGGDSYICTASYNQAMITPSHFRSLKGYGARLRNNDPYLMRAYDSFGPKLASFVGKNKAADTTAAFLTNYYRAVQTKSSLTATQKAFSIMSDYVLRPAYRIMGWVLVKFVDKK